MTPARFRFLIFLHILLMFVAVAASMFLADEALSPGLRQAYEAEPRPAGVLPEWLYTSFLMVFLAAMVASVVGLYRFRPWGRTLSLWLTLAPLPLAFLGGPLLESPLESSLSDIASMLWGAIVAVAYFSPLSARFAGMPDPH